MNWALLVQVGDWTLAELLVHVPNGGARSKAEGGRFKAMGVKAGYPDILLDLRTEKYGGARWELKYGPGKPSDKQIERHAILRACGFYVAVHWHWHECAQDILRYLQHSPFPVIVRARP